MDDLGTYLGQWLGQRAASLNDLERFAARSDEFRQKGQEICPRCFTDPKEPAPEQVLIRFAPWVSQGEAWRCPNCGTQFDVTGPPARPRHGPRPPGPAHEPFNHWPGAVAES